MGAASNAAAPLCLANEAGGQALQLLLLSIITHIVVSIVHQTTPVVIALELSRSMPEQLCCCHHCHCFANWISTLFGCFLV